MLRSRASRREGSGSAHLVEHIGSAAAGGDPEDEALLVDTLAAADSLDDLDLTILDD
jgi:hypothetical protein